MATAFEAVEPVEPVPDLLRRFMSTPHRATLWLGSELASVETNDVDLLRSLPVLTAPGEAKKSELHLKVIVDPELQLSDNAAPVVLDTGLVLFGRVQEMLFAVDCQARTAQVFMTKLHPAAFREFLKNIICERVQSP